MLVLAAALAVGGIFLPVGSPLTAASGDRPAATADTHPHIAETYAKVPLSFEANRGQTDPRVRFLARGPGHTVYLTPTEAVLVFNTSNDGTAPRGTLKTPFAAASDSPARSPNRTSTVLRMAFAGANPTPPRDPNDFTEADTSAVQTEGDANFEHEIGGS